MDLANLLYDPNFHYARNNFMPPQQGGYPRDGEESESDLPFRPLAADLPEVECVGYLADEFDRNSSFSEDEGIEDYKKGGYHPVFIGEVLNGRYVVLQKLGWGHFSTVWLSRDIKFNTYVAIKVQKSASHYLEAAFDEVEILQKAVKHSHDPEWLKDLKEVYGEEREDFGVDDCHVVQLLNAFIYQGPYGRHFCMVFEILGVNLLEIIKRYDYRGIPIQICRRMAQQILLGLHYLHKYCGIIHTDLKPENVMVCLSDSELREIFDSGQLNSQNKIRERLRLVRRRIAEMNRQPIEDSDPFDDGAMPQTGSAEEASSPDFERTSEKFSPPNPLRKGGDGQSHLAHKLSGDNCMDNESRGTFELVPILTEEDLQREYERLVSDQNITNKNEKKNLKKRLKKRLKRNRQKLEEVGMSLDQNPIELDSPASVPRPRDPKGSLKVTMTKRDFKPNQKPHMTLHPLFFKSGLSENFRIKIADLGNGCWVHHHFQPEIQTRQYRSPEVILGINYNETADTWSFACMLFEMLTGEFLFNPHKTSGWSKSQDHLTLMMEMLNRFPRNYSTIGTHSKKYITSDGHLRKVPELNFVTLQELLTKKYSVKEDEANFLSEFLLPMLRIYPQERFSALEALRHPWLTRESVEFFTVEQRPDNQDLYPNHFTPEKEFPEFHKVVDVENFDADKSNASDFVDDDAEPEVSVDFYDKECRHFDRSFKSIYVGYADGIDLNAMDNTANWQFDQKFH